MIRISIGNTSNSFYYATTSSKSVELDEDLTGGEWLVPPIGFAICDGIPQLPIECARNQGACAINWSMQSRTLGYAVGMSGTDWQIKSWPAMVLGGEFDERWNDPSHFGPLQHRPPQHRTLVNTAEKLSYICKKKKISTIYFLKRSEC